jgi:hypothetical protein
MSFAFFYFGLVVQVDLLVNKQHVLYHNRTMFIVLKNETRLNCNRLVKIATRDKVKLQ